MLKIGLKLKNAGISILALPASDICMMGRSDDGSKRRGVCPVDKLFDMGVTAAFATNNIQNLFTFTGDGDVLKIGTLLCQLLQLTSENGAFQCIEMATKIAAKALGVQHFIGINQPADLVILGSGIKDPRSGIKGSSSTPIKVSALQNDKHIKSNVEISSEKVSEEFLDPSIPDISSQINTLNHPHSHPMSSSSFSSSSPSSSSSSSSPSSSSSLPLSILPSALLPSALKLLAAPPVDRIVIKRGRVVSRTVVQRAIFR